MRTVQIAMPIGQTHLIKWKQWLCIPTPLPSNALESLSDRGKKGGVCEEIKNLTLPEKARDINWEWGIKKDLDIPPFELYSYYDNWEGGESRGRMKN